MSGERIRDQLRRLRRETPRETPESRRSGLSDSMRRQLDAQEERRAARVEAQVDPTPAHGLCATTVGDPRDLVPRSNAHGTFLAREEELEEHALHGDWVLREAFDVDPRDFALLCADDELAELDLGRAVFLDTETTGLSGGAGTYVYQIGLGSFERGRFVLWQGFLASPADERALLAETARRIDAADAVVSFFGKSFDRHRLEDKMRIAGVEPPFDGRPHLDLYHPFRRLTKGQFVDGRLATMERELCGLGRVDDLPGAFAPAAWFDYLAGREHRLEGVFRHNRDDVLSLVTLAAYLGRAVVEERSDGRPLAGPGSARARAIARAHLAGGDRREALPWLECGVERARAAGVGYRDLELARAEALRQLREHDAARSAFEALLDGPQDHFTVPASIGFAKLLEHGLRDAPAAHAVCERARELVERWHVGSERTRFAADLERRSARLG